MKTAFIFAAVSGLLSSASAAEYFGVIAARSASPIHLQEITASGEGLWIGKKTSAYCPSSVPDQGGVCPAGKHTNFAGGQGSLAMGALVPGGQQVYIDRKTGRVHYTIAHSADTGDNAILGGWSRTPQPGESYGHLNWKKRGLLACATSGDFQTGPWQIYANLKSVKFDQDACAGFDALTSNQTKADAWQYT